MVRRKRAQMLFEGVCFSESRTFDILPEEDFAPSSEIDVERIFETYDKLVRYAKRHRKNGAFRD